MTTKLKATTAKKVQIVEKLREIKQRQENWLHQRNEHTKNASADKSRGHVAVLSYVSDTNQIEKMADKKHTKQLGSLDALKVNQVDSSHHLASEVSDKLNVNVNHGFGAWLKSRKDEASNGKEHCNNSLESNGIESTSGYISKHSHPLSPKQFNYLANSIVDRVKQDLGIADNNTCSRKNQSETMDLETAAVKIQSAGQCDDGCRKDNGYIRGKTFVQNNLPVRGAFSNDNNDNSVDVSNHCCPSCSILMAATDYFPTLLVPCGHTVCKHCAISYNSCKLCGTHVASLTTNIMLQQIIHEFHQKNHSKGTILQQASQGDGSINTVAKHKLDKKTVKLTDYSAQLQRLRERQEAMTEEAISRRQERDRIMLRVQRAEKQVGAIRREEESLLKEMQKLEEQLQGLRRHKEEYILEYQNLQEEQQKASTQVAVVEETLRSLAEEIDKVKFLSEGQKLYM